MWMWADGGVADRGLRMFRGRDRRGHGCSGVSSTASAGNAPRQQLVKHGMSAMNSYVLVIFLPETSWKRGVALYMPSDLISVLARVCEAEQVPTWRPSTMPIDAISQAQLLNSIFRDTGHLGGEMSRCVTIRRMPQQPSTVSAAASPLPSPALNRRMGVWKLRMFLLICSLICTSSPP